MIPFYSGHTGLMRLWPELEPLLEEAIGRGRFVNGPLVARLEAALSAYTGAGAAVAVASGTDALTILLSAAGVGPGDEVIVPAYSFVASATSVVHLRATPVFADVDPVTRTLRPDEVERRIGPRTVAIMPVHLFDRMADMSALRAVAENAGVLVLEDSAEAIGMRQDGRHAGRHGLGGVLSFFPAKTLGALGDAGAILTDDEATADLCRCLRNHGETGRVPYEWAVPGFNSRMDDLQAAVLLARLARLDADIDRRAALAATYDEALAALAPAVVRPAPAPGAVHYVYLVEVERRDALAAHLARRGIGTEVYYPAPLHLQPCFAELGYRPGELPVAERVCARALALPLYPDLDEDAVATVCAAIAAFYESPRAERRRRLLRTSS
jgi:dTDP-4-amino-4,6-dideoxygalactose transaminase